MKLLAMLIIILPLRCGAVESISIKGVINNTKKAVTIQLDQGYKGKFVYSKDSYLVDARDKNEFEFTHAWLNDKGIGGRSPSAQTIVVGIKPLWRKMSYHSPAIYIERIPTIKKLTEIKKVSDYKKIFGSFRGMTDGWGFPGETHSSLGWIGFSRLKDGSIRVVTIFLWTVDRGEGFVVEHRKIGEGVFKPTGKPPKVKRK